MENHNELIHRTEVFLKETFGNSLLDPKACAYRLEHSYRVANIGREIALKEDLDPTEMVIACLLHDISYSRPMETREDWCEHGRLSAKMANPFLVDLGFSQDRIQDICYGIAIHVDGKADLDGETTAFAETVSDADNIDRFDVYRIYETLNACRFQELTLAEKQLKTDAMLQGLHELKSMPMATKTASALWQDRIHFYISFYERLKRQLCNSTVIAQE